MILDTRKGFYHLASLHSRGGLRLLGARREADRADCGTVTSESGEDSDRSDGGDQFALATSFLPFLQSSQVVQEPASDEKQEQIQPEENERTRNRGAAEEEKPTKAKPNKQLECYPFPHEIMCTIRPYPGVL